MPHEKLSFQESAFLGAVDVISSITPHNVLDLLKTASNPEVFGDTITQWRPDLAEAVDLAIDKITFTNMHCEFCCHHVFEGEAHLCPSPTNFLP